MYSDHNCGRGARWVRCGICVRSAASRTLKKRPAAGCRAGTERMLRDLGRFPILFSRHRTAHLPMESGRVSELAAATRCPPRATVAQGRAALRCPGAQAGRSSGLQSSEAPLPPSVSRAGVGWSAGRTASPRSSKTPSGQTVQVDVEVEVAAEALHRDHDARVQRRDRAEVVPSLHVAPLVLHLPRQLLGHRGEQVGVVAEPHRPMSLGDPRPSNTGCPFPSHSSVHVKTGLLVDAHDGRIHSERACVRATSCIPNGLPKDMSTLRT